MANIKIHHYGTGGSNQKTYVVEGMLQIREKKSQQSVDLPFPGVADNGAVINSIFGQKRTFACAFIIMDRDDDYTNGTGSPSNYTSAEQKDFLMDDVFKVNGYHVLEDENGNTFNGRIEDIEIIKSGDDPIKYDATFMFKRGIVPLAGQFTPF